MRKIIAWKFSSRRWENCLSHSIHVLHVRKSPWWIHDDISMLESSLIYSRTHSQADDVFNIFFPSFLSFLFCKYFPYSTLTLNVINLLLPSIFVTFNSSHIVVVSSASNTSIYDFKVWLFSLISSQKTWPSDLIYRLFYECVCVWLCGKFPPVVNSIHCCCCMDSGETCNPIASHEMKLLFCW